MAIDYPPVFINNYLAELIPDTLPNYFSAPDGKMRFFPTQPTTIDTLTEQFPDASEDVFAVYDRMFRMRRKPFPHIRIEQLLYYFYKTSGGMDALIETTQLVADLLDRGDESGEDINRWIASKLSIVSNTAPIAKGTNVTVNGKEYQTLRFGPVSFDQNGNPLHKEFYLPYFHDFKIYQLEEARDIIDFGTARTYAGNKIIIEYTWHKSGPA